MLTTFQMRASAPAFTVGVSVLLLALASCGGGGSDAGSTAVQADTLRRSMMPVSATVAPGALYGTEHAYMGLAEYSCVTKDFEDHFGVGDVTQHLPIATNTSPLSVLVSELERVVSEVAICVDAGPVPHAVTVHYGLDNFDGLDVVLQVQCLAYDASAGEYHLAANKDCLVIGTDGKLTLMKGGMEAWQAKAGGGRRYANKVYIQRDTDGPWELFDVAGDVNSTVFPVEGELDQLIAQNSLKPTDKLQLVPIATPQFRTKLADGSYEEIGYRQGICWLPVGKTLSDGQQTAGKFQARAADLGSPCPPACAGLRFTFPENGIAPREGCTPK